MRAPPRLRGSLATRFVALILGCFLFGVGTVSILESRLGLSPWDVLHQGIAKHTPLTFGEATIVVSVCVIALAWRLGARIGIGTIANGLLVGSTVQLLTSFHAVTRLADASLGWRIVLLLGGIGIIGLASGFYIGAAMQAGPRDSLMVVGARRTKYRIGVVRGGLELLAFGAGFALGGTVGVGTVAFAVLIGPAVEGSFWLLERCSLAVPARLPVLDPVS